jgi:hypothetical protein
MVKERTSLVEAACEWEDCTRGRYSSHKTAKRRTRRSHEVIGQDPHDDEWGIYRVAKAYEK